MHSTGSIANKGDGSSSPPDKGDGSSDEAEESPVMESVAAVQS